MIFQPFRLYKSGFVILAGPTPAGGTQTPMTESTAHIRTHRPRYASGRAGLLLRVVLRVVLLAAALATAGPSPAAEAPPSWEVTADRLEQDRSSDRYVAEGHVTISRAGLQLSADRVVFDRRTLQALAEGHVVVTDGRDVITGRRLEMNLETETGTVHHGTVFLAANHFYIRGERLHKTGPDTYRGERVRLTTCEGDPPDWEISGSRLEVTIEGYGTVDHAVFRVRRRPLAYAPKLVFPAKRSRQSGLLPPRLGYSSRQWEEITQPLFWAIDPHQDATFYLHHMGRRGEQFGLQYRYILGPASKGVLMADLLADRKVDDGTAASEDWAYPDTAARGNTDRYWVRFKHDQKLPAGFQARLDLDLVSDPDYLREFSDGLTGFDATDRIFQQAFDRELDPYEDAVRTNRLNLNRTWARYSLNLDTQWRDDVAGRRADGVNDVLQQLQSVTFDGVRQPLGDSAFLFDLDSEYRYFYLDNRRRGHRADLHPRLYRPLRLGVLHLEPSVGLRETLWYSATDGTEPTEVDQLLGRTMADFKLDASGALQRVYHPDRWGIQALQHYIRPQVIYQYRPPVSQSKYPSFDDLDRVDEVNQVTTVLTQTLTTRRPPRNPQASGDGSVRQSAPVYREVARLEVSETYDIVEARESDPLARSDANRRRPWTPVRVELDLSPHDALVLHADAEHSPYAGHADNCNLAVEVADPRGDRLWVEHRSTYEDSRSLFTRLQVPLADRLTTYGEWERNLLDRHNLQTGIGVLYAASCWALDVGYQYEHGGGKELAFMVHLFGLGGVGQPSVIANRISDPFARRRLEGD